MDDQRAARAPTGVASWKSRARVEASRRNGACSQGPASEKGRQRAAQNALKHGLRAQRFVLLDDEDSGEFEALGQALREQLAPQDALQEILVARLTLAVWRMFRTDRMEVELLNPHLGLDARGRAGGLGTALIRDGHGPRAFDTLSRYRGAVQAEFWRALRGLSALKAGEPGAAAPALGTAPAPADWPGRPADPVPDGGRSAPNPAERRPEPAGGNPNEPECRRNSGEIIGSGRRYSG